MSKHRDGVVSPELSEGGLTIQKSCPICQSLSTVIDTVPTINPSSKEIIELRECVACKHWWHNPLPKQETLNEFYKNGSEYVVPKNYATATLENQPDATSLWENIFKASSRHSKKINKTDKGFNYLEIGIGSGRLFEFFKQRANIAYGVEPGDWVDTKSNTIVSSVDQLPDDVTFDMIIAHDVLEHLNDPGEMLSTLRKVANDGCVINCTFPNKDALKAKIQKGRWHMVRPFGHLHYFSSQSLETMFTASGWTITEKRNCRIIENTSLDLIKQFDVSAKNMLYRLVKSLLIGQILLGKDQWTVIAVRK